MKVTSQGSIYSIHGDGLVTHESLPAYVYELKYSTGNGFYLERRDTPEHKEDKIYGKHLEKCQKILNAFSRTNRNLGALFSGNRGIGKTLCVKALMCEALKRGYPVINVADCYSGIEHFLSSIDCECVVVFDEFDKKYDLDSQNGLLNLLDGFFNGKMLFVVTCNKVSEISEYMLNRPGRFHYHIRFEYPSVEDVREYLTDKLPEKYYSEIPSVIMFSQMVNLNFDCLRAIVFEISSGLTFKEAIKDLNIMYNGGNTYNLAVGYKDGSILRAFDLDIDLFDPSDEAEARLHNEKDVYVGTLFFKSSDVIFNEEKLSLEIPAQNAVVYYKQELSSSKERDLYEILDDYDELLVKEESKLCKNPYLHKPIEYIRINCAKPRSYHYSI